MKSILGMEKGKDYNRDNITTKVTNEADIKNVLDETYKEKFKEVTYRWFNNQTA